MRVTALWVYPIKGLRGIPIQAATLTPQGVQHDRCFMICKVLPDGSLQHVQLSKFPQCSLFEQDIVEDHISVNYITPHEPLVPQHPLQKETLKVPLTPDPSHLTRADINLHNSKVLAYRMSDEHSDWFTACFGFDVVLCYIGNERRPVLGTFSPDAAPQSSSLPAPQRGWLSSITSTVMGSASPSEPPSTSTSSEWLTFSDCAPYLLTTDASLKNVEARMSSPDQVDMFKFRPNIVVDGEVEWDEDFWDELSTEHGQPLFTLTKMCNRCISLNVDYDTGKPGQGEKGQLLKKLMSDRRVDKGSKYTPVFGVYGFLAKEACRQSTHHLQIGDTIHVTKKKTERPVFDWPTKDESAARYYK